jgi:hypothetical protein
MTPRDGEPPFKVVIQDGEKMVTEVAFEDHDAACAFAIEQLRLATQTEVQ